jgi:hypothetical protein
MEKRKKKFKALELSTTVVGLGLLSAFVPRQEACGYVILFFFNQRNFLENSSIGAVLHLACEAISLSARRRGGFLSLTRCYLTLACVAPLFNQETAFIVVCLLRLSAAVYRKFFSFSQRLSLNYLHTP